MFHLQMLMFQEHILRGQEHYQDKRDSGQKVLVRKYEVVLDQKYNPNHPTCSSARFLPSQVLFLLLLTQSDSLLFV